MKYDKKNFTYGMELEWGDINKSLVLPETLGTWDYSECDVINSNGIAADPSGKEVQFGGEINTIPSHGIDGQVAIVEQLKEFFTKNGCPPSESFVSHLHIHVRVPGMTEDIDALKKLMHFIQQNQAYTASLCSRYREVPGMSKFPQATSYFKLDGARQMPGWIIENIVNKTFNFEQFVQMHRRGKSGDLSAVDIRPFRYGINTYSLKHIGTVEFRMFRCTTNPELVRNCLQFVEAFMHCAMNDIDLQEEVDRLGLNSGSFPEMHFDPVAYETFLATKHKSDPKLKVRKFYDI